MNNGREYFDFSMRMLNHLVRSLKIRNF